MKNLKFKPLNFAVLAIIYFVLGSAIIDPSATLLAGSATLAFISGTLLSFSGISNVLGAVEVQIWENHIEEEIFKGNEFLNHSFNASEYVIGSKAVHIPQSGGSGNVVKNRTTFPATIRKRTDTDVIYLIDEFTSDPVKIPHADTKELSYDKRQSVLGEDIDKLKEVVAEWMIQNWLASPASLGYSASQIPAGNILKTSGTGTVAATAPGATGNRKPADINDLQKLRVYFKQINMWREGKMHILMPPNMEAEIFPANSAITAQYMASVTESERRSGVMYKAQGFQIHTRSSVVSLTVNDVLNAPGAVGNADDNEAALVWYEGAVEKAMGPVEFFEDLRNPEHYADIYSFLVRMGGRARRADYKGIALLAQAPTT
ncbi:hypothetical protein Q4603_05705 [Zobellia galactanivorans]|uniref:hypothetical protein n=1 Tax=Zobellia galactanivorans (strain DSM 12802 / CCUG 47099 / CIP 106680 / NCIMB 13871 / Dsij) TaxID=63186 RepID=UPI0026E3AAA4|nr:hypothetical protein [Zobellia galactanivorans]MDO6808090.1 hypothetical protein [Zobellia galactanivorans]